MIVLLVLVAGVACYGGYFCGRLRRLPRFRYTIDMQAALHVDDLVLMPAEALDELVVQAIAAESDIPPEELP